MRIKVPAGIRRLLRDALIALLGAAATWFFTFVIIARPRLVYRYFTDVVPRTATRVHVRGSDGAILPGPPRPAVFEEKVLTVRLANVGRGTASDISIMSADMPETSFVVAPAPRWEYGKNRSVIVDQLPPHDTVAVTFVLQRWTRTLDGDEALARDFDGQLVVVDRDETTGNMHRVSQHSDWFEESGRPKVGVIAHGVDGVLLETWRYDAIVYPDPSMRWTTQLEHWGARQATRPTPLWLWGATAAAAAIYMWRKRAKTPHG